MSVFKIYFTPFILLCLCNPWNMNIVLNVLTLQCHLIILVQLSFDVIFPPLPYHYFTLTCYKTFYQLLLFVPNSHPTFACIYIWLITRAVAKGGCGGCDTQPWKRFCQQIKLKLVFAGRFLEIWIISIQLSAKQVARSKRK